MDEKTKTVKVGVFDSGVGGKSVANAIKKSIATAEVHYRDDPENVPYGTKTAEELKPLVLPKLKELEELGCKVIVIACNTASMLLVDELRQEINVPLVPIEPMLLEAASQTSSNVIAVCATPSTLASDRYKQLKDYNPLVRYIEPDCSKWATMIETNSLDSKTITETIQDVLSQGADTIVLGCTHYHWVEELIKQAANGHASVLQPEPIIINELKTALKL